MLKKWCAYKYIVRRAQGYQCAGRISYALVELRLANPVRRAGIEFRYDRSGDDICGVTKLGLCEVTQPSRRCSLVVVYEGDHVTCCKCNTPIPGVRDAPTRLDYVSEGEESREVFTR